MCCTRTHTPPLLCAAHEHIPRPYSVLHTNTYPALTLCCTRTHTPPLLCAAHEHIPRPYSVLHTNIYPALTLCCTRTHTPPLLCAAHEHIPRPYSVLHTNTYPALTLCCTRTHTPPLLLATCVFFHWPFHLLTCSIPLSPIKFSFHFPYQIPIPISLHPQFLQKQIPDVKFAKHGKYQKIRHHNNFTVQSSTDMTTSASGTTWSTSCVAAVVPTYQ